MLCNSPREPDCSACTSATLTRQRPRSAAQLPGKVIAYPLKADVYAAEQEAAAESASDRDLYLDGNMVLFSRTAEPEAMGLGLGGKIRQTIYEDERPLSDYDSNHCARCFVHLVNSQQWQQITSEDLPRKPVTRRHYQRAGLPWFDYYNDHKAGVAGSKILGKLKSVGQLQKKPKKDKELKINRVIRLGDSNRVSEGQF